MQGEGEQHGRPLPTKLAKNTARPTAREIEEHEAQGHVHYRSWCPFCVAARGTGQSHSQKHHCDGEIPTVVTDYGYLNADESDSVGTRKEDSITMLVMHDCLPAGTGCYGASAVPVKGKNEFSAGVATDFFTHIGHKKCMYQSDGEYPMLAHKREVCSKIEGKELLLRESPVGEHQANGSAENAIKTIKGAVRTIVIAAQAKWKHRLPFGHPLVLWAPTYAAQAINRFKIGDDGKTPEQRRTGKRWEKVAVPFGERIQVKELVKDVRKRDLEPRWLTGYYVGHASRSGTALVLTASGVQRGTSVVRLPDDKRWEWIEDEILHLKGKPWDWKSGGEERIAAAPADVAPRARRMDPPIVVAMPAAMEQIDRSFYVTKANVVDPAVGPSPGCVACEQIMVQGRASVTHSAVCRARVIGLLAASGDQRLQRHREARAQEVPGAEASAPVPEVPAVVEAARSDPPPTPLRSADGQRLKSARTEGPQAGTLSQRVRPREEGTLVTMVAAGDQQQAMNSAPGTAGAAAAAQPSPSASAAPIGPSPGGGAATSSASAAGTMSVGVLDEIPMELQSLSFSEYCNPGCFTELAGEFGMIPGLIADINLNDRATQEPMDMTLEVNQHRYMAALEDQDPFLVIGAPQCTRYSRLQNLNFGKQDPEKMMQDDQLDETLLHFGMEVYKDRHAKGRWFLHEHPWSATSWQDEKVVEVASMPGVIIVQGDMCAWGLEAEDQKGTTGPVKKSTGWMTNNRRIADVLSARCPGRHTHVSLLGGGRAKKAQKYTRSLRRAILHALRDELEEIGEINAITGAGPVPDEDIELFKPDVPPYSPNVDEWFWDDVNGGWLKAAQVQIARGEELSWMKRREVLEPCDESVCWATTGKAPLRCRWVDTNKGDERKENYRSRLVAMEIKKAKKPEEQLSASELFSSTPPLEAFRLLCSLLITLRRSSRGLPLKLGFWDVSRAHLYGKAQRDLFVRLPAEDGGGCFRLLRSLYGTQDAASTWQCDWTEQMEQDGWKAGLASPALIFRPTDEGRGLVHGDDFMVLGDAVTLREVDSQLKQRYDVKCSGILGCEPDDLREVVFLNRVIRYVPGAAPAVEIESDQRHVELLIKELGLEQESKGLDVPAVKKTDADVDAEAKLPTLPLDEVRRYRSVVMRAAYLTWDRPDIVDAVKQCSRKMQSPTSADMTMAKRLGRYLVKYPCLVTRFGQQKVPSSITATVDSDYAGCLLTRKSTSGTVLAFGDHTLSATGSLQSTVSLSSGEAEYYAILRGAAAGLKLAALAMDLGIEKHVEIVTKKGEFPVEVCGDSTAAIAFASRQGLGRQKHVMTRYLWVQHAVKSKRISLRKVDTKENVADPLTKPLSSQVIQKHLKRMGCHFRSKWSALHRSIRGHDQKVGDG